MIQLFIATSLLLSVVEVHEEFLSKINFCGLNSDPEQLLRGGWAQLGRVVPLLWVLLEREGVLFALDVCITPLWGPLKGGDNVSSIYTPLLPLQLQAQRSAK